MQYKINIEALILQETGTYNKQFARPYFAQMDQETLTVLENRMDQFQSPAVGQPQKIGGGLLSGIADRLLKPRAEVGNVLQIPQGWDERRLKFILQVACDNGAGGTIRYYIQGFTSHLGIIQDSVAMNTGHVDPNMVFYVNTVVGTITSYQQTAFGYQPMTRVIENTQVINGVVQNMQSPSMAMRPLEVYTDIQFNHLNVGYKEYLRGGDISVLDTRPSESAESVRSKRANNLAGTYLGDFITAQKSSSLAAGLIDGPQDQLGMCRQTVFETPLIENPFFAALFKVRGMSGAAQFFMGDLAKIDATVTAKTDYKKVSQVMLGSFHQANTGTSDWHGQDHQTLSAFTLVNGLSAIMMDLFITVIQFRSTNMMGGNQIVTTIEHAESFVQGADMRGHYASLIARLEKEILKEISIDNNYAFDISVKADLFLETWVTITVAGMPVTTFVLPSFCDAMMAPVIADSVNYRQNFSSEMEKLFNHLNGASNSSSQILANL